jgi:hypothetical protein
LIDIQDIVVLRMLDVEPSDDVTNGSGNSQKS